MSKATKKSIRYGLCAALLIALAMWTRWASRTDFHDYGWNYLRSGIYVFLFGAWGLSIRFRIVQTHVRRYLLMIAALMMLWLLLRSVKFSIDNVDAERLLWYCYYLPMLFIPMLSMFVSLSLGKAEDFQLPRWTKLLYLPTTLLLLLVLTNDLHQFVFFFPSGVMSDQDYRYKAGYFLVVMWEFLCAVVSITMILRNCRIPHSRRFCWLPLVPLVMSVGYAVAYVRGTHWVWVIAGDMTVTLCLIFASIFESCIQCGLIQSNLGYDELFEATSLPVQITDRALCPQFVSAAMQQPLPQSELRSMQQDSVRLSGDTLLKRHALRRGWVFWKEDISELNQLRQELEMTRDELRDTGDILAAENAQRARLLKLTEENHLYDMMEAQTARQISMLRDRLTELQRTEDPERARRLLGQVILIGTYIKRRNNLIFVGVQRGAISAQELRLCLNESVENLNLYGVDCKAFVHGDRQLTIEEAGLESLRSLLICIEAGSEAELRLCAADTRSLSGLQEQFPGVEWELEEDGLQYIVRKLGTSGGK